MKRVVFLGVVLIVAVAVVGFSIAADKTAKVAPVVDGADAPAGGCCPLAAGCSTKEGCPLAAGCSAKEGCPLAAAGCAAGGCAATGCSAKKKVALVCPVSGDPADKTIFASYGGGKVYFRCNGCKAKFEKDARKFAAKANLQLVSTGQFVQKGCPCSGHKVAKETEISLSDVKVSFCGKGCQGKVAKAKPEKQLEMLFSNKAFEKAFEPAKKKEKVEEKKAG